MPVFVKIDEYDDVLSLLRMVRTKMEEAWQNTLVEVEKKIDFIDHSLNEPEHF